MPMNHSKHIMGYVSTTPAIEHDVFECGKDKHAMLYERSKKVFTVYIMRMGDNKSVPVDELIETMMMPMISHHHMPPE